MSESTRTKIQEASRYVLPKYAPVCEEGREHGLVKRRRGHLDVCLPLRTQGVYLPCRLRCLLSAHCRPVRSSSRQLLYLWESCRPGPCLGHLWDRDIPPPPVSRDLLADVLRIKELDERAAGALFCSDTLQQAGEKEVVSQPRRDSVRIRYWVLCSPTRPALGSVDIWHCRGINRLTSSRRSRIPRHLRLGAKGLQLASRNGGINTSSSACHSATWMLFRTSRLPMPRWIRILALPSCK